MDGVPNAGDRPEESGYVGLAAGDRTWVSWRFVDLRAHVELLDHCGQSLPRHSAVHSPGARITQEARVFTITVVRSAGLA